MSRFKETLLPIAQIANLTILALIAVEIALCSYYNEATGVFAVVIAALSTYLGALSYLLWGKREAGLYKALRFAWKFAFRDLYRSLVALFVLVSSAVFLGFAVYDSSRVAPKGEAEITSFEIRHLRKNTRQQVGIIGETSDVVDLNDSARIRVELTQPRYCFLIAFNPDGKDQLCIPLDRNEVPRLTKSIVYHPQLDMAFRFTDGVGAQAFVLLVSREPLPSFNAWIAAHGPVPWHKTNWKGVWVFDGQQLDRRDKDRAEGKLETTELQPFVELCNSLSDRNEMELIYAIGFPVLPVTADDEANERGEPKR